MSYQVSQIIFHIKLRRTISSEVLSVFILCETKPRRKSFPSSSCYAQCTCMLQFVWQVGGWIMDQVCSLSSNCDELICSLSWGFDNMFHCLREALKFIKLELSGNYFQRCGWGQRVNQKCPIFAKAKPIQTKSEISQDLGNRS